MGRKKRILEKEAVKLIITSKRMAEIFIERWKTQHEATREEAIEKLKEYEIDITQLPD